MIIWFTCSSNRSYTYSESESAPAPQSKASELSLKLLQRLPHWCFFKKVSMPVFPWSPTPLELQEPKVVITLGKQTEKKGTCRVYGSWRQTMYWCLHRSRQLPLQLEIIHEWSHKNIKGTYFEDHIEQWIPSWTDRHNEWTCSECCRACFDPMVDIHSFRSSVWLCWFALVRKAR